MSARTGGTTMSEQNIELARRLFEEVFNGRNIAICEEIVATHYIENALAPFGDNPPGAVSGPEHMRNVVEWLVEQFPDIVMTIESIVADDDTVSVRVHSEGTNLGLFNGVMPPTGKRFSGRQGHWFRIHEGKLAEHWAVRDDLRTMLQLGVMQPPAPPA